MAACKGDARSMGHARRTFPPGPLPEGIPVGFCLKSRAAGYVGGLFTTTMHGIELEERRNGVAVTLVAGGNYNNRMVECGGLMEDQLGGATCVIEGQGGQQHNNGVQIEHQTFDSSGNAGMRRAQEAGSPLRLWLKVSMPNNQLKEQYGLCYTGQWKVTDSWLWTNPRDGFRRCRFLLQRLPGQAPMPRRPLYIRGESGAKRANQLQQLCTEALWDGSLGGSVLADVCSKCWCVSNYHEFASSFGIDLACGGKGRRRRKQGSSSSSSIIYIKAEEGGSDGEERSEDEEDVEEADGHGQQGSGSSGGGDGQQHGSNRLGAQGTQQAGEQPQRGRHTRPPPAPRPNIVCSSCHVAEVCHSCLSDAAFTQYAGTDEPWLCAYCEAADKRRPTAGIASVTVTPAVVTALAKQAAAALAGSLQLVAEGKLQADAARERELRAAAEQWLQRAQRLGIELNSLPESAAAAAAGCGKVERQRGQQGRRQQQQQQQEMPAGQTQQQQQPTGQTEQQQQQQQQPIGQTEQQQQQPSGQTEQQEQRQQGRRQQQQQQPTGQTEQQEQRQQQLGPAEQVVAGPLPAGGQKRPRSEQAMDVPDGSLATPATKRPAPSSQHDAYIPAATPAPASAMAAAAARATPVTPAQALALPPVTPGSAQATASSRPTLQVQQRSTQQHGGQHALQPLLDEEQQQAPAQPGSAAAMCCLDATAFGAAHPADGRAGADPAAIATAAAPATMAAAGAAGAVGAAASAACTAGDEEREVEMLELLSGLLDLLEGRVRPADLLAFSERFKGGSSTTELGLARRKVLARQLGIAAGQGGTALLSLLAQPIDPAAAGSK